MASLENGGSPVFGVALVERLKNSLDAEATSLCIRGDKVGR